MEISIPGTGITYTENGYHQLYFFFIQTEDAYKWIAVAAEREGIAYQYAETFGQVLLSSPASILISNVLRNQRHLDDKKVMM